ncbi:Leukotoxin [Roseovarius litorisediminis]|uniref:Leukotoxin n=1 Tax=Roseovarius litorisediminis TaxID=1312363 RepID=A0A1Y5TNF0_9RHOB|nr:calcium-binding protein [Roseovarius litorisediminis]SLN68147.1 Leukotoxin [Roseovarius litorisediminis]
MTVAPLDTVGSDNPVVSFNLSGLNDYGTNSPFIDIAKTMRPWVSGRGSEGYSYEDLRDGGYLDENGWVTHIPEGQDKVSTVWAWSDESDATAYRSGVYIMEYEGTGEFRFKGSGVNVLSNEDGRIVFENTDGGTILLEILETDPEGTGDYIRNISVVHEDDLELYESGAVFNPEWLAFVADAREFRFMDWMRTNGSDAQSWDDRPTMDSATWMADGAPVELMVQLANEAGTDPWFTMPHMADDEYVRKFAEYVRDNLDPALTVRVEYSNELWNFAFKQTHYMRDQALEEWGIDTGTAFIDYQIKRATEVGSIWQEVFAANAEAPELLNVIGTQTGNAWALDRMMNAEVWQEMEPDGFIDPTTVFDEVAITTYFGSKTIKKAELREELLNAIEDPDVDAAAWLAQKLMDPDYPNSIPEQQAQWINSKEAGDKFGLDLVAYEGGQHVHHSFSVGGLTAEQTTALTTFMSEFVRSPEMAQLYEELWNAWASVSDGAFMQFGVVSSPSKYGSWGIWSSLEDENPRGDFLLDQMENGTPWWDAAAKDAYQQGITVQGTNEGELLIGTAQEDYLVGNGGNDVFVAGAGRDGINGGEGVDRIILNGSFDDYSITKDGNGFRIVGPDGEKYVFDVEEIEFDGGDIRNVDGLEIENAIPAPLPTTDEQIPLPPPPTDEPVDQDRTDTGTFQLGLDQQIADAAEFNGKVEILVQPGESSGIKIASVGTNSILGQELNSSGGETFWAHTISNRDTLLAVDGETVSANYWSLQYNKVSKDGLEISGSATETALKFGSVVEHASNFVMTSLNDSFVGNGMDEEVYGNGGDDVLIGRGGNDTLIGGDGNDWFQGGRGDDLLNGGAGDDVLKGGKGSDRFYFTAGSGNDVVKDFSAEDTLELDGFLAANQSFVDAFGATETGELMITNGVDTVVFESLDMTDLDWLVTLA